MSVSKIKLHKPSIIFFTSVALLIASMFLTSLAQQSPQFSDGDEGAFNLGTYANTRWNQTSASLSLQSGVLAGTYSSQIRDAGAPASFSTLNWNSKLPYDRELPDGGQSETLYPDGNASMNGNVLLMHMNDAAGPIVDSSGTSNNGTVSGALAYGANGKFKNGIGFNGIDATVEIPYSQSLDFATTDYSYSVWINTTESLRRGILVGQGASSNRWGIGFPDAVYGIGTIWVNICKSGIAGYCASVNSTSSVNDGQWHHIAATFDRDAEMKLYIDGVSVGAPVNISSYFNNPINGGGSTPPDTTVHIGKSGPYFYNGRMDELAIFSRVLSASEIAQHYARGIGRIKFQLRSCDDALCTGESFTGPGLSASSYFSESSALNGAIPQNKYVQYKAFIESDLANSSPELKSVTIGYVPVPLPTPAPTPVAPSPTIIYAPATTASPPPAPPVDGRTCPPSQAPIALDKPPAIQIGDFIAHGVSIIKTSKGSPLEPILIESPDIKFSIDALGVDFVLIKNSTSKEHTYVHLDYKKALQFTLPEEPSSQVLEVILMNQKQSEFQRFEISFQFARSSAPSIQLLTSQLKRGDTGNEVRRLQDVLREGGYLNLSTSTGFFGKQTAKAVQQFQRDNNLAVTGDVSQQSLDALNKFALPTLKEDAFRFTTEKKFGDRHEDVQKLQEKLHELGYFSSIKKNTYFGKLTERALKQFQLDNKLAPTGTLAPETRELLNKN